MTALSERMVQAAARARRNMSEHEWNLVTPEVRAVWCDQERPILGAALAVAEEAGAGVFVVPEKKGHPGDVERYVYGHADGYNACRADTLAGRVTL